VDHYQGDIPLADDLALVPLYTGAEPVTAPWLWQQYNEHRLPLPKLLLWGLGAASGWDYRAGAYFNCAALSGLCLGMILTARSLRGSTSVTDGVFPLALLHVGQAETLLFSFTVNLVTAAVLGGVALLIVVRARRTPTWRQGLLLGLVLLALPLCGSAGVALVPALAVWLGYAAVALWRSGQPGGRRHAVALAALAALDCALVGLYFWGYFRPVPPATEPPLAHRVRTSLQFFAGGLGPVAESIWPASALLVVLLAGASAVLLAGVWRRQPDERARALGLALYACGIAALGLGIGWGRAHLGDAAGFGSRYVTLAAPLLCCAYFAWVLYSGRLVPRLLLLTFAVFAAVDTVQGLQRGARRAEATAAIHADIRRGLSPKQLGDKYASAIGLPGGEDIFAGRLEMMRQARQGPYRHQPEE